MEEQDTYQPLILKQAPWLPKLVEFQLDLISNSLISLFSSFSSLSSSIDPHPSRPPQTFKRRLTSPTPTAPSLLLKRIGYGFVGATYVGMVLLAVMAVAVVLGVGLVRLWVEDPVFVREKLNFDYTDIHPQAVFSFKGSGRMGGDRKKKVVVGLPAGHTICVSLVLLMPESDFNREIGIFQLTAEVLSRNGVIIAKSSQPCMLQFRSLPIRLIRTSLMTAPLLLGIVEETQRPTIVMIRYKEGHHQRTEAIRITLIPRAGTSYVPQLYNAEIIIRSQLPWIKRLVHDWKLTFYVWTSLNIFIMLVIVILCCFKPLVFPTVADEHGGPRQVVVEEVKEPESVLQRESEFSETLRRWQQYRRKRKAALLSGSFLETIGTSASSYTVTREGTLLYTEDESEVSDSGSVCLGG
ncbi:hypothetical protein Ancab_024498 [Ancistrocladus abbreviatus]